MEENSVKHVPPDGFFGIQILPNSISAGALPRIPLGELTMLPRPSSQLGVSPTVPHHFFALAPNLYFRQNSVTSAGPHLSSLSKTAPPTAAAVLVSRRCIDIRAEL